MDTQMQRTVYPLSSALAPDRLRHGAFVRRVAPARARLIGNCANE